MHLPMPDPRTIAVDPERALAALAAEADRARRSTRATAAAVAHEAAQRAETEARVRRAVLAYAAERRHPLDHLVMPTAPAPRPVL